MYYTLSVIAYPFIYIGSLIISLLFGLFEFIKSQFHTANYIGELAQKHSILPWQLNKIREVLVEKMAKDMAEKMAKYSKEESEE